MRSPRLRVTVLACGILTSVGQMALRAEEPATTKDLPLALKALGVSDTCRLSCRQAHDIRGTGSLSLTEGAIVQFIGTSQLAGGQFEWAGVVGGKNVTLAFDPAGLSFRADGMAVVTDDVPYQGIIATQTGVFDGQLLFQGDTSTVTVLAVPGLFAVDFR